MGRRVSAIAVTRLCEARLGLTMAVEDWGQTRYARLTARAETSSIAGLVLSPIDRRPSKFDGPEAGHREWRRTSPELTPRPEGCRG
jgi:hypothetical protein